jgi:uncharacterized membrane protein YphA (DoxX/SURF4 family)
MKIYYIMMLVSVYAFMILLMYFLAGINKISSFNSTVEGFKHVLPMKGLPQIFYTLAIAAVIILEITAPLMIMVSLQTDSYQEYAYYSSIGLASFTALVTLIYHFPTKEGQYYSFIKNVTAMGALMLLSTLFLQK